MSLYPFPKKKRRSGRPSLFSATASKKKKEKRKKRHGGNSCVKKKYNCPPVCPHRYPLIFRNGICLFIPPFEPYFTPPALVHDIQQTSLMRGKIHSCINIKSHFIWRKNASVSSSDRVYVFSLFFKSKHILRYMTLLSRLSTARGRHPSAQNEASIFCSMRGESFPLCRDDI